MNKNLRRAIIKRSKLKNKANKTKHPLDIMNYKNNVIMSQSQTKHQNLNVLVT